MRGVFFHHPLEYRLEVPSDDRAQGDTLRGVLTVKNHSGEPAEVADLCVKLSLGDIKKVKSKALDAFEDLFSATIARSLQLAPGESAVREWIIETDRNCPIAGTAQSPYLQYGDASSPQALGHLPLPVKPHKYIQAVVDTMQTVFNFTTRGLSSKGGQVVARLKSPDSRRLSLVEELNLGFRFEGEDLQVSYLFKVKRFDTSAATKVDVRKEKVEVLQNWKVGEYTFGGGFVQQEFIERAIKEGLEVVTTSF